MTDTISKEHRSWNMSRIRGKDTKPERIVRSALHRMGYRFRLHVKTLPGRPDIVLPLHKTVIFVHGCFWHQHLGCKQAAFPRSRTAFWRSKLAGNVIRDALVTGALRFGGWKVKVIWECEVNRSDTLRPFLVRRLGELVSEPACSTPTNHLPSHRRSQQTAD